MNINERQTPITDAACAAIDLDSEGYPPRTYEALKTLSECSRALERRLGEANHKLFTVNFPKEQATHCAKCGQYKHTPWREDGIGYVCATCLVAIKDEQSSAIKAELKVCADTITRLDYILKPSMAERPTTRIMIDQSLSQPFTQAALAK